MISVYCDDISGPRWKHGRAAIDQIAHLKSMGRIGDVMIEVSPDHKFTKRELAVLPAEYTKRKVKGKR